MLSFPVLAKAEASASTVSTLAPPKSNTSIQPPANAKPTGTDAPMGRWVSLGLVGGIYVGLNMVAYLAWWANSPPDQFEWVHDTWFESTSYAGGSDKFGHLYMNHLLTRATAGILEEGGWHRRTSTYAGASLTLGAYYVIEMRDAFSTGFSKNDMIANVVGAATGVLMREFPVLDELFDTRIQYVPSGGYLKRFRKRGFNFNEDYTGFTFMLAWHLCTVPFIEQRAGLLRFADLVVGYNTRNYRPKPADPHATRYQDAFIGISLNLQRIIDELWTGERHPRFAQTAGRTHRVMRFATEFVNAPYTHLPVLTWSHENLR